MLLLTPGLQGQVCPISVTTIRAENALGNGRCIGLELLFIDEAMGDELIALVAVMALNDVLMAFNLQSEAIKGFYGLKKKRHEQRIGHKTDQWDRKPIDQFM
jgi:hypothetical protein